VTERNAVKLEALRQRIAAGVAALDRGDFVEIDEADLDDYLDGLTVNAAQSANAGRPMP
jgi:hypothetical protein